MSNHQIRLSLSIITSCLLATLIIGPLVALIGQTLVGQSPSQLWSQLTQPTNCVSIQHSLFLSGGHGRRDNPASHPFGMDHDAHPFNKARLVALALVSAIHDTTIY
nr:hypothetical protein [Lactiplantibacillus plantarum]